jgi:DNA ligase 4
LKSSDLIIKANDSAIAVLNGIVRLSFSGLQITESVSLHKIRKYVKRSGRLIGTARDSPVDSNEHLMIMFFDILLLDDIVCIREPYDKRRQLFQSLVHCIPGQADIGIREIIDFSSYNILKLLSEIFARAIARR